ILNYVDRPPRHRHLREPPEIRRRRLRHQTVVCGHSRPRKTRRRERSQVRPRSRRPPSIAPGKQTRGKPFPQRHVSHPAHRAAHPLSNVHESPRLVWGRAFLPVQAERSSAVACGHSHPGLSIGVLAVPSFCLDPLRNEGRKNKTAQLSPHRSSSHPFVVRKSRTPVPAAACHSEGTTHLEPANRGRTLSAYECPTRRPRTTAYTKLNQLPMVLLQSIKNKKKDARKTQQFPHR